MRAFVTGAQGFVGTWLLTHLKASGDEVAVAPEGLDVRDSAGLRDEVVAAAPDAVYHLAAFTHVGRSWEEPAEVFRVNAEGTLNLLEAARAAGTDPRVLLVSSAEVYGSVDPDRLPVAESAPLAPVTPYAASKVAAEYLGVQAHLGHGARVVRARPFNHVGPGQSPEFAVAALAQRVVDAERTGGVVRVGNLSTRRDFTDVRDVVRAYRSLVVHGTDGEVYNVCSGRSVAISEVAERLVGLSERPLELEVDPELVRPVDVPVVEGDAARLVAATGWHPEIALDDTLRCVLDHWREAAASAATRGSP